MKTGGQGKSPSSRPSADKSKSKGPSSGNKKNTRPGGDSSAQKKQRPSTASQPPKDRSRLCRRSGRSGGCAPASGAGAPGGRDPNDGKPNKNNRSGDKGNQKANKKNEKKPDKKETPSQDAGSAPGGGRLTRSKTGPQGQKQDAPESKHEKAGRPKLQVDTSGNGAEKPDKNKSPQSPTSAKSAKSGKSPQSPTTPGAPPRIVDTTRKSEYERLWPKPGTAPPAKPGDRGGSRRKSGAQQKIDQKKIDKEEATKKKQEQANKDRVQQQLKDPRHKPQRPDADWTPPRPDPKPDSETDKGRKQKPAYHLPEADRKAGRTPYHPNEQSSGKITAPDRKPQYSGEPGSPRNDPGFIKYTNRHDPYDRSYVRKEQFRGEDGKKKVGATGVYDGRNMPYHAANKLNNLKANPDHTYAEVAKGQGTHRDVTDNVRQTYDENRRNPKNTGHLANPKDEMPHSGTVVKDKGKDREAKTNVAPVPDRESRGEFPPIQSTDFFADRLIDL